MRQIYWDETDIMRRLRRIEGQVRGIQNMIQRQDPCSNILTQISAIEGAMRQVSRIVEACKVAEQVTSKSVQDVDPDIVKGILKEIIKSG